MSWTDVVIFLFCFDGFSSVFFFVTYIYDYHNSHYSEKASYQFCENFIFFCLYNLRGKKIKIRNQKKKKKKKKILSKYLFFIMILIFNYSQYIYFCVKKISTHREDWMPRARDVAIPVSNVLGHLGDRSVNKIFWRPRRYDDTNFFLKPLDVTNYQNKRIIWTVKIWPTPNSAEISVLRVSVKILNRPKKTLKFFFDNYLPV